MPKFIGRKKELIVLSRLLEKKSASIFVVKGRRRIGKSRLIQEFSQQHHFDNIYFFSGVAPNSSTTCESQLDEFAYQLSEQTGLPEIKSDNWNKLFLLLNEKTKTGRTLVLFDEISWMGSKDHDFLGKLKKAWDNSFKQNDKLILGLCGSVSSWIDKNILSSTNFVGRISIDLTLTELPLQDCVKFWGSKAKRFSNYEICKMLLITGGVPLYLEHLNINESAEENIQQLAFSPYGLLFNEFSKIFHDLFSNKSEKYQSILSLLSTRSATRDDIIEHLKLQKSGDISAYLDDLIQAGFISRDFTWKINQGTYSNLSVYRLSDNYTRFYLKYILPNANKIQHAKFASIKIDSLPGWYSTLGFQFENLVLNNRQLIWQSLNIDPANIICDNPYFQRKTKRNKGCQIDYLIQTKHKTLYIVEIKFSSEKIGQSVVAEVQRKVEALTMPKNFSYRTVLVHISGVSEALTECDYFSKIIDLGKYFLKED